MNKSKLALSIAAATAALSFSAGSAAAINYSSEFTGATDLDSDGWVGYVNVFDGYLVDTTGTATPNAGYPGNFKFGFGYTPAPFNGPQVAALGSETDLSGNTNDFMNVYSHYDCCNGAGAEGHFDDGNADGDGALDLFNPDYDSSKRDVVVPAVFQEFAIGAADIGNTITFTFDARLSSPDASGNDTFVASGTECPGGNTAAHLGCTAGAFIKTIDPGSGYALTNYVPLSMDLGNLAAGTWTTFSVTLDLADPLLDGQLLQAGFENWSSIFGNSAVEYDRVCITDDGSTDCFIEAPAANVPFPAYAIALFGGLLGLTGIRSLRKRTK